MHDALGEQGVEWNDIYRRVGARTALWESCSALDQVFGRFTESSACLVLDAGCGDGKNSIRLGCGTGATYIGLDMSLDALRIAKSARSPQKGQFQYLNANLFSLPLRDGCFERVACVDVINHVRSPAGIFKELRRVVKPTGEALVSLFNVDDEIRCDTRGYGEMTRISGNDEYVYCLKGEGRRFEWFFRFVDFERVEEFFEGSGFEVRDKCVKLVCDEPHPFFRPYPHQHCNIYVTLGPVP